MEGESNDGFNTHPNWEDDELCGIDFDDSVQCNLTKMDFVDRIDEDTWYDWEATNGITKDYNDGKSNTSFIFRASNENRTSSNYGETTFYSKEYADISLRPYLNITYSTPTPPVVNLTSPSNNTITSTLTHSFNASYTTSTGALVNSTLYIWNSTNDIINQTTESITGTSNSTNISVTFTYDDVYEWNYYACNDVVFCGWADANFILTIDTTPPTFTNLINLSTDANSSFSYDIDATDSSGISCFTVNDTTNFAINCSGYLINNTVLNVETYWLNISVNDSANNTAYGIIYVDVTVWDTILKWDWGALMTDSTSPDQICFEFRGGEQCFSDSTITFAFGEIIDNLVDGWITITGSLNVTGNITAENVFIPAYISSHTNDTIVVSSAGNWMNVTFDHEADEFKKRITHTPNDDTNITFTIQDTGLYEITYTMSFQDSAVVPNSHVVTRVTNNNVELNGFTVEEDLGIQDQDKLLHHSDLVELTVGDEIVLSFTSDDTTVSLTSHLTYGIHKNTGHLTIKRVA